MGKRRNTAKTGDKALYNSRSQQAQAGGGSSGKTKDDDPLYGAADRFHNERDGDFIRLGDGGGGRRGSDDEEELALLGNREAVLDLGAGGETSDEDDNDQDDDDDDDGDASSENDGRRKKTTTSTPDAPDSEDDGDDDSSSGDHDMDEEDDVEPDPRRWGKKKSLYYHGDTADLEIGQDEGDAFLEEEAAKEIQASRFEEMDEEDFVLSEDDEGGRSKPTDYERNGTHEQLSTVRDPSKLSKKAARKLLQKQHPELLPMVSYFSDIVKDLKDRTQVAADALLDGEGTAESVGATVQGQRYLLTKALIQKSIALNSVMYLLLRSASAGHDDEDATSNIQAHPVMAQLKNFNSILQKFEEQVHNKTVGIDLQLDNLVKAAALMRESGDMASDDESTRSEELDTYEEADDEDRPSGEVASRAGEDATEEGRDDARGKQQDFRKTLNEARFGLRPREANVHSIGLRKRRIGDLEDFGDLEEERSTSATKTLSSTINTIEQRSQVASRKRRPAPVAETLDDLDGYDDQLAQGIKMMEEEMGKLDDDYDEVDKGHGEDKTDPEYAGESSDFYSAVVERSKAKKSFKKSLYQVAPKLPGTDGEVDGERAISRTILKNRGLVAHKAKINRNPRVKHREKYRKAVRNRKGAVREIRQDEGHKYGGEGTGIKSGISRSRKLTIK